MKTILSIILVGLTLGSVVGCASKSFTKPRSQILVEAESDGVQVSSIEEDRLLFEQAQQINEDRLIQLLKQRADASDVDSSYKIGPSDELEINVFDVPELNVTARVRESGFISLPLIGAIKAVGQTEPEIHEELVTRLRSYVRNPQVSVFISSYGSQKVAVLGAVRKPGTYSLKKGANSILQLLSEAGGVNDRAGNFINFVPAELSGIRADSDVETRARLALATHQTKNLKESGIELQLDQVMGSTGGIPLEIPVRGGDMVIVPDAGKVNVDGEVQKVGSYDLGPRMSLLGALAAAGGITYGAKIDEIEVVRDVGGDHKGRLVLNLEHVMRGEQPDVKLKNGDLVVVPSDSGRRMRQDTFEGISKFLNFGVGGSVNLANP